jgi:hypothetical protein
MLDQPNPSSPSRRIVVPAGQVTAMLRPRSTDPHPGPRQCRTNRGDIGGRKLSCYPMHRERSRGIADILMRTGDLPDGHAPASGRAGLAARHPGLAGQVVVVRGQIETPV